MTAALRSATWQFAGSTFAATPIGTKLNKSVRPVGFLVTCTVPGDDAVVILWLNYSGTRIPVYCVRQTTIGSNKIAFLGKSAEKSSTFVTDLANPLNIPTEGVYGWFPADQPVEWLDGNNTAFTVTLDITVVIVGFGTVTMLYHEDDPAVKSYD